MTWTLVIAVLAFTLAGTTYCLALSEFRKVYARIQELEKRGR